MRSIPFPSANVARRPGRVASLILIVLCLAPSLFADGSVSTARDLYKEYIEMRKLIGEETAAWTSQKETLADMLAVLKSEQDQLESAIDNLKGSATSADQKRAELNAQLEEARATSTAFNDTIAGLETELNKLVARLPGPLVTELRPLLARIPEDPSTSRLSYSQRLQSVIGVLAQTDKFNSDIKYVSAVQPVNGESIEVQTIYFGLGAALYTDATGKFAGHGAPGADGWKWTPASATEAPVIAQAIDIYLSRRAPAFVSVPLQID